MLLLLKLSNSTFNYQTVNFLTNVNFFDLLSSQESYRQFSRHFEYNLLIFVYAGKVTACFPLIYPRNLITFNALLFLFKLISVFLCVCHPIDDKLHIVNCGTTLACSSWFRGHSGNVMIQFIINKRTEA